MLSWIPLLGPILQGLFSTVTTIYSKLKDTQLGMRQAEVEEAKVSADIIATTNDDIGLRIIRDLMIVPGAAWFFLGGWDTIVAHHWPNLKFVVAEFPPQLAYYPYAVLTFLLGNIGMNMWNRNK